MHILTKIATCMTPIALTLTACSSPAPVDPPIPHHAAHLYFGIDTSRSSRLLDNDRVGDGIRRHIADAVKSLALGDDVTVFEIGGLEASRFVAYPTIVTGYKLRQAAASRKVAAQMAEIAQRIRESGGDASTNLLLTLENLHPDCKSSRSVVVMVSDAIESSQAYDAGAALNAGRPVELPAPPAQFLQGCKIVFLGFGIVATANGGPVQVIPKNQLLALRTGWTQYLTAAGVAPGDVTFTSLL